MTRFSIYSTLITLLVICTSFTGIRNSTSLSANGLADDNPSKNEVLFDMVMEGMQRGHYAPAIFNDEYSKNVYALFLKSLDRNKRFFIQSDIDKLSKYQLKIDDAIRSNSLEFFNLSYETITQRIKESEIIYKEILAQPLDYSIEETLETNIETRAFPKNEEERRELWRKSFKLQIISKLDLMMDSQEKAVDDNDTSVTILTFEEMEEKARGKVRKSYKNFFNTMNKLDENDRMADFLNALVNTFDPHTGYYPPKDKENFDIYISGQLEGIGAQLQEKDEGITVTRIVPGSASWKQGELKAGDIILSVAQGLEEPVDITEMRLDNAVKIIRGKKGTEVRLTVKKMEGPIAIISIIRDVVILEETYAKSAIIENQSKAGYIKLPKFYMNMNQPGGRSCATDVKKELEKLKAEGVSGIILDLRNNGGGSLQDAIKMAGYFIEKGPIVQVKTRIGTPYIMNDTDPEIVYNGPLVVMVNSFSVSASEIVAAALQDYGRAVIIGSATTYGKGTVQRFINLDEFITGGVEDLRPLGAIKMTTQKFYRINGGATQLKGVSSDIMLPDNYSYFDIGEKELDHYLVWDEIQPAGYSKGPWLNNMEAIVQKSKLRMNTHEKFILIDENAHRLKEQRDNSIYSLNLEAYRAEMQQIDEEAEKYKDLRKDSTGIKVFQPKIDYETFSADTAKMERIEAWHKNLKKDIYLFEALSVIEDMNSRSLGYKEEDSE